MPLGTLLTECPTSALWSQQCFKRAGVLIIIFPGYFVLFICIIRTRESTWARLSYLDCCSMEHARVMPSKARAAERYGAQRARHHTASQQRNGAVLVQQRGWRVGNCVQPFGVCSARVHKDPHMSSELFKSPTATCRKERKRKKNFSSWRRPPTTWRLDGDATHRSRDTSHTYGRSSSRSRSTRVSDTEGPPTASRFVFSGHEKSHELEPRRVESHVVTELGPIELVKKTQNSFVARGKPIVLDSHHEQLGHRPATPWASAAAAAGR
jgi:hypothetical protein